MESREVGHVCTFYLGQKMRELTTYHALSHSWVFSLSLLNTFCDGDILSKGAILMIRDITWNAKVKFSAGKKRKWRFKPGPVKSPSVRSLL